MEKFILARQVERSKKDGKNIKKIVLVENLKLGHYIEQLINMVLIISLLKQLKKQTSLMNEKNSGLNIMVHLKMVTMLH